MFYILSVFNPSVQGSQCRLHINHLTKSLKKTNSALIELRLYLMFYVVTDTTNVFNWILSAQNTSCKNDGNCI